VWQPDRREGEFTFLFIQTRVKLWTVVNISYDDDGLSKHATDKSELVLLVAHL